MTHFLSFPAKHTIGRLRQIEEDSGLHIFDEVREKNFLFEVDFVKLINIQSHKISTSTQLITMPLPRLDTQWLEVIVSRANLVAPAELLCKNCQS